jgi:arylsulfatase A-like enzyme
MEFHGLRYLYTQRSIITDDNWKYIFTPGDIDEVYDLDSDPAEMRNLLHDPGSAGKTADLRDRLMRSVVEAGDPVMDAVHKILGRWESPSGQIDPSTLK